MHSESDSTDEECHQRKKTSKKKKKRESEVNSETDDSMKGGCCHHKNNNPEDDSNCENDDIDAEDYIFKGLETMEQKKKDPDRLHPDLWHNDPGEVSF